MRIERWGETLAVRLPEALVRSLGLEEGDEIALRVDADGIAVAREPGPDEILASLRRFRGGLPAAERLRRDDANDR
jgi:antitoxin MazE